MVSVLIVDDDAMVRTGLKMVLSADPSLTVVGEAVNGQQAITSVQQLQPDVVLMDLQMPVLDGIRATGALRGLPSPPAVLVLTTFQVDAQILEALSAGASGYLLKDTDPIEIARAVHVAAGGGSVFSPTVTELLVRRAAGTEQSQVVADARRRLAALTERELDVAAAVAAGKSNATIARELFMSEATVKTHVSRILAKLQADNRVQVALAVYDSRRTGP